MPLLIQDELLTVDELTQVLKINRRTVYRMLEDGDLPFAIKMKGSWRFKSSDIDAWLEQSKLTNQVILA